MKFSNYLVILEWYIIAKMYLRQNFLKFKNQNLGINYIQAAAKKYLFC